MLSALRRQNPGETAPGYGSAKLSSLLPQMQARSDHQRRPSKNQNNQARRIDAELSPSTEMLCVFLGGIRRAFILKIGFRGSRSYADIDAIFFIR